MSEVVINVTKVEEVVTINATPNVTQILVNTNSGGGAVNSVFGRSGNVTAQSGDYETNEITESTNKKFVTDDEKTKLSNLSGTNTGDETTSTIQTKRPLKTINNESLEGSGNIVISGGGAVDSVNGLTGAVVLGDLSNLDQVDTNEIVNHAVTNVKLEQMNSNTLKGRLSGNGTPQDIAMSDLPISTATQTALDLKSDKSDFEDWTDFSGTSTITGWTLPDINFLQYTRRGKDFVMRGRITGISNSTSAITITIPFTLADLGISQVDLSAQYINNSVVSPTPALIVGVNNSNEVRFFRDGTTTLAWTSGNTKTISFLTTLILQ